MRNAALVLGIIGGLFAMMVGFFSYGYTEAAARYAEIEEIFGPVANREMIRIVSFAAPILAIAGGAMAKARALWGGVLMIVAAVGIYAAFGFGVFTMFPLGFCLLGGILALAAGKPDEPKAHF
ncbi:hypothetical protein M8756_04205 [Lutimaribacter sp. EGI FJ00015]|uniref:Uncharacterized protein n=1 Tax=Lutimaribacter degradans TaxID=2945989 RepID=A0ACC5ZRY1_9RHOB|nr:hypothetical protein [Lutimaribacter sp. EGI FJ00013]MCM2560556.1 hypothetical protein [Lutimaribacter sp. EGI FJ00013]MCO0612501.1 hypothetical protein [Lutimaribacter sp. EGI FJ00015]MCO0634380.1 hypothetical protein [Lutimaribacter sp. EGI FJ00014]